MAKDTILVERVFTMRNSNYKKKIYSRNKEASFALTASDNLSL
jgi:hypothetical protein